MTNILLTGSSGLIGSRIVELLKSEFAFLTPSSSELDITNPQITKAYLQSNQFDFLMHFAGYTDVDKAETEREACRQINVEGTRNLCQFLPPGAKLIFISTDFVFDGQAESYNEDSPPSPISYYGQTKAEAEQIVGSLGAIVRLSYPYCAQPLLKKDFVTGIKTRLASGQEVRGITDSIITPTFIDDIAFGLRALLNNFAPNVYHLVGRESLSPFDAFNKIAATFSLPENLILPITFEEFFANKAMRPRNSKIVSKHALYPTHSFTEGLNLVKQQLN